MRLYSPSSSRYFTGEREKKEHKGDGNGKILERMLQVANTAVALARLGKGCLVRSDAVRPRDVNLLPVRACRSTHT